MLFILVILLVYVLTHKDVIVREYLTLQSLEDQQTQTASDLAALTTDYNNMKTQMQAQSQQAAAAQASLSAIPSN